MRVRNKFTPSEKEPPYTEEDIAAGKNRELREIDIDRECKACGWSDPRNE